MFCFCKHSKASYRPPPTVYPPAPRLPCPPHCLIIPPYPERMTHGHNTSRSLPSYFCRRSISRVETAVSLQGPTHISLDIHLLCHFDSEHGVRAPESRRVPLYYASSTCAPTLSMTENQVLPGKYRYLSGSEPTTFCPSLLYRCTVFSLDHRDATASLLKESLFCPDIAAKLFRRPIARSTTPKNTLENNIY